MSEQGRLFREAWIDGVKRHFPGSPKPGYIAPWEAMPEWEQRSAEAVYEQIVHFVRISEGATAKLSREQRGQFIAACWNAQVHKHFESPKPSYVANWSDLPDWQQQTDSDIFDAIEKQAA